MTSKPLASMSACTVALLFAGCGGKILYPHYYALDIPPAPILRRPMRACRPRWRCAGSKLCRTCDRGGLYTVKVRRKLASTSITGGLPIPPRR